VTRFVAARPTLSTLREFGGFLGYAAFLGSALGATIGAATLLAFGLTDSFLQSWKVWWGSNAMAILLLSPFILTWFAAPAERDTRSPQPDRLPEAMLLALLLIGLTWHLLAAGEGIMAPDKARMLLPLLWAGLRFRARGAAAANLLLALPIAFFTTRFHAGLTPAQIASGDYVFVMQTTLAVAALVALLPAIVLGERRRAEEKLQRSLGRLQELSRRLADVEEAERRNISRELHDRVGQNLSALNLSLNLVRAQLPTDAASAVGERLLDAQSLVEASVRQVRDVMADLRPPALDDYGLLAALRTHADALSERLGVPVVVTGREPEPRLSPAAETALFRIAQEALNNVSKHARATTVEIHLTAVNGTAELSVTDDGVGFDATSPSPQRATWGLKTMRERAEAVGATLRIEPAPAGGTRVLVAVDCGAASWIHNG
jgi:signal transduction histidine kinase